MADRENEYWWIRLDKGSHLEPAEIFFEADKPARVLMLGYDLCCGVPIKDFEVRSYDEDGDCTVSSRLELVARIKPHVPSHLDPATEIDALKLFLASADQRWKKARAEADAARSDLARMKSAWLNAVGGRLLWRPDLVAALAETTTDMRVRLDELDEEASGARLSEMVAEYGPFVASPVEEDA